MTEIEKLDRIAINVRSHKLLRQLLTENPTLEKILRNSKNETEVVVGVREWIEKSLNDREDAFRFYHARQSSRELFEKLAEAFEESVACLNRPRIAILNIDATPTDAMVLVDGVFVGSGIFKSDEPAKMAAAIVEASGGAARIAPETPSMADLAALFTGPETGSLRRRYEESVAEGLVKTGEFLSEGAWRARRMQTRASRRSGSLRRPRVVRRYPLRLERQALHVGRPARAFAKLVAAVVSRDL